MYQYPMKEVQSLTFSLEECVDEWSDGRTLRQDQQHCENAQRDQDRRHPPTLVVPEEGEHFSRDSKAMARGLQEAHSDSFPPKLLRLTANECNSAAKNCCGD